ncbi:MAG TPA: hypothetical protein ENJ19_06480 [Gammaproteobacteria bacterium]|nr:hypothetical protein [Gammaproteobacteria bacterium]
MESWVAALPLANVGETARRVFHALQAVQEENISGAQLFRVLEQLRPVIAYLSDALARHYHDAPLPAPGKSRKAAAAAGALYDAFAQAYERVFENIALQNRLAQDGDLYLAAVHRALSYRGEALLVACQRYEPPPPGSWLKINALYRMAEERGMHAREVSSPLPRDGACTTVKDLYTRVVLLALAGPERLTQQELHDVYELLAAWAPHCRLSRGGLAAAADAMLSFERAMDAPPAPIDPASAPNPEAVLHLDTRQLEPLLKRAMEHASATPRRPRGEPSARRALGRHVLRGLHRAWRALDRRRFTRAAARAPVRAILGLSACHKVFAGHNAPPARGSGQVFTAELDNESASGARLRYGGEVAARVGDLLAVNISENGITHGIAVVRWLKCADTDTVELGLQWLAPRATALDIRRLGAPVKGEALHGLLLPPVQAAGIGASILVPAYLFHPGEMLVLKSRRGEERVKLTRVVDATRAYTRFHYRSLDNEDEPGEPLSRSSPGHSSLWSGL